MPKKTRTKKTRATRQRRPPNPVQVAKQMALGVQAEQHKREREQLKAHQAKERAALSSEQKRVRGVKREHQKGERATQRKAQARERAELRRTFAPPKPRKRPLSYAENVAAEEYEG